MKGDDVELFQGDCLELMCDLPAGCVDLILCDPPYGTMKEFECVDHGMSGKASWDDALDPTEFFAQCERVLRMNGMMVLFSQEPYTSRLITEAHSNLPFCYRMVWLKDHFANGLIAKKAPVSYFEDILVFTKRFDTNGDHPLRKYASVVKQFIGRPKKQIFEEMGNQGACHFLRPESLQFMLCTEETYRQLCELYGLHNEEWFKPYDQLVSMNLRYQRTFNLPAGKKVKSNVLEYRKDYTGHHPTQKPVALLEDLVTTYSRPGDTVADFTMGSGSTGVACVKTGRRFIGMELDAGYFDIARQRIAAEVALIELSCAAGSSKDQVELLPAAE